MAGSRWDLFTDREVDILQCAFEYMSEAVDHDVYEDISDFWDDLVAEWKRRADEGRIPGVRRKVF